MNVQIGTKNGILILAAPLDPLYLYTGINYKIEEFPLEWYDGQYYETYRDQVFKVDILTEKKTAAEYDNFKNIDIPDLINFNTIFSVTLLKKFKNLDFLRLPNTNITLEDISNNKELEVVNLVNCPNVKILNIENNLKLDNLNLSNTQSIISNIDNNILLRFLYLRLTDSTINNINNNTALIALYIDSTNSKLETVINNPQLTNLRIQETNTTAEDINQILQDLITNNVPISKEGTFYYSNLAGINGSLENQLTDLNWTLIKL